MIYHTGGSEHSMRKLFLHIGTHRTATSSIQDFLHANLQPLQKQGVFYPFGVKRHFALVNRIFQDRPRAFAPLDAADLAEDLTRRADKRPETIRSIILSDEDIVMRRDLTPLRGLRERFDVKVVFFLRRQDLWLESWYLQNVKWQWDPSLCHLTFADFMARADDFHWIDYAGYIRHLEAVFGRENILLQVFEKDQMPQGPVEAFCQRVGIESRELKPAPHANSSNSPLISEFMRNLPLDEAPVAYRAQLESACARLDAKLDKSPEEASPFLLDADTRATVLDHYAAGNAWVAERYFDRDRLFLMPLPPQDAPVARMALPDGSADLIQRLVAPFLRELIAIHAEDKTAAPAPRTTPKPAA